MSEQRQRVEAEAREWSQPFSISNERGLWIDCDYTLTRGDLIDAHTLEESGETATTRDAVVSHYLDDDEHGHRVVYTDKGAFSYYSTSIFLLKSAGEMTDLQDQPTGAGDDHE